jgi:hypothetical protein
VAPSGPLTPGSELAAASDRTLGLDGSMAITSDYSKRDSVSADLTGRQTRFLNNAISDITAWGGHAKLRHQLSRGLAFHLGYGLDEVRYRSVASEPVTYQTIDVGLDYANALAVASRTTFSFYTSTSALRFVHQTRYLIGGGATLTRAFARSWSASLAYMRGTEFLAAFSQPALTDSITARVDGLLTRRVQWYSVAGVSRGTIWPDGSTFTASSATSGVQTGITHHLGVFGQYSYYRYEAPPGSTIALLGRFSRQSVTVGLTMWVPMVNRARAPR